MSDVGVGSRRRGSIVPILVPIWADDWEVDFGYHRQQNSSSSSASSSNNPRPTSSSPYQLVPRPKWTNRRVAFGETGKH